MADEKDDDMTTAERTTWLRERVRETEFFPMERLYKYLEYGMMWWFMWQSKQNSSELTTIATTTTIKQPYSCH